MSGLRPGETGGAASVPPLAAAIAYAQEHVLSSQPLIAPIADAFVAGAKWARAVAKHDCYDNECASTINGLRRELDEARAALAGLRPSDTSADDDEGTCPECRRIGGIHALGCNFGNAVAERARAMRVSDAFAAAVRRFGKAADASVGETRYIDPDYLPAREALQAMVRGTSLVTGIAPHDPTGVSATNPEAGPWTVDGKPVDVDEDDDDDARGWYVNGRPVSARDIDHGPESEGWTVNGAPVPEDEHAKCRVRLEAERERYRRALGILVDASSVARKVVAYVDSEAETKR
jgi:hypothetical protein